MSPELFAWGMKLVGYVLVAGFVGFVAFKIIAGIAKGVIAVLLLVLLRAHGVHVKTARDRALFWLVEERWRDLPSDYTYWRKA